MKTLVILAAVLHLGWFHEAREPFTVPDVCTDTFPDKGSCSDNISRWFYNPNDGQCKEFMYTGCGGNENNFKYKKACEERCKGSQKTPDASIVDVRTDVTETTDESAKGIERVAHDDADKGHQMENSNEEDSDDGEEGFDDGEEDDNLLSTYLNVEGGLTVDDSEVLKEAMNSMEVSAMQVQGEDDGNPQEKPSERREVRISHGEADESGKVSTIRTQDPIAIQNPVSEESAGVDEDDDDDDGFIDDNGPEIDTFLDHLGDAIDPTDRETLLEGIAELGATALKSTDEIEEGMEIVPFSDAPQQPSDKDSTEETQSDTKDELGETKDVIDLAKKSVSPVVGSNNFQEGIKDNTDEHIGNDEDKGDDNEHNGDDDDDNDDEPEGIDLDVEYPILNGFISPEDRETLAEAISLFDTVEAIPDRRNLKPTDEIVAELLVPSNDDGAQSVVENDQREVIKVPVQEKSEVDILRDQEQLPPPQDAAQTIADPHVDDMINSGPDDDEEEGVDPVDEIINNDQRAIFKPAELNPMDRTTLSELVSQFDVAVMEEHDEVDQTEEQETKEMTRPFMNRAGQHGFYAEDNRPKAPEGLLSSMCTFPPVPGPCRARKLKWFFNMETGKCETFIFGGCQGNGNRFLSRRRCIKRCGGTYSSHTNQLALT